MTATLPGPEVSGTLMTHDAVVELIESGTPLLVAADGARLAQLPRGSWIGGSIPYFSTVSDGGCEDRERYFVDILPSEATAVRVASYDADELWRIYRDAPHHGVSFVILPAASRAHTRFALEGPDYAGYLVKPLVGWVAGCPLSEVGQTAPVVVDGATGAPSSERAVALHLALPAERSARVDVVNLFEPGNGDVLTFLHGGFEVREVCVDGRCVSFAGYLAERGIDTRLPLVCDHAGANVNVSFLDVDAVADVVTFCGPVFPGREYRVARPIRDYVRDFADGIPAGAAGATFSCTSVLNYVYAEVAGRPFRGVRGPMTFGEIGYQLLNQTLITCTIG